MILRNKILLAAVFLTAALPAHAILIRPDRDDQKYLDLGARYPSSCLIGLPDGEGTLIAPRWILTAAHIGNVVPDAKPPARPQFDADAYDIEKVVLHPDWKKRGPHDIALLKLKTPVKNVEPTPIYRGKAEGGQLATIVGHGYTGTLDKGPLPKEKWDKKKRGATNHIVLVRNRPDMLVMRIKPLDMATDLQGAAAPGDSGGPAFIEINGKLFVAGVGVATDDAQGDGIVGNYGDRELYTRVSAYAEWIDKVMKENGS